MSTPSPRQTTLFSAANQSASRRWNHHLLSTVAHRPDWLTIGAGSKAYVDAVVKSLPPDRLFLNTPVRSIKRESGGRVRLCLDGGLSEVYDHVILATHGDEAFTIIESSATDEEKDIMSRFHTSRNEVVLHSDISMLPASRNAWASWNYLSLSSPAGQASKVIDRVSLTYNMNILQHIPVNTFGHVLVTLNPLSEPEATSVQGRYTYTHPLFTADAVRAQQLLPRIQNTRGISYAGAWTKYGFHEDGFSSGLAVAIQHLGARLPFDFVDSTFSRGRVPRLGIVDWVLRIMLWTIQVCLVAVVEKTFGKSRAVQGRSTPQPPDGSTKGRGKKASKHA